MIKFTPARTRSNRLSRVVDPDKVESDMKARKSKADDDDAVWHNRIDPNPPAPNQALIDRILKGQPKMASVFEQYRPIAYPYNFQITLHVPVIAGGTPSDPRVAEGWIKTKLGADKDDVIREMVAEVMVEKGVDINEATEIVNMNKHLNGFRKDPKKGLYIEGRQAKAAIKEAANVRWPKDRWGPTRKGTLSFFAEHVFVPETRIYLNEAETGVPTAVNQRFVHTFRGSGIQYEEYVENAELMFHVTTDFNFTDEQWGLLWLTGEQQGIGASRSQGYGKYEVAAWKQV